MRSSGDTFVRLLRFAGREVDIQNYIDNTGVQVADVVVGFLHIEKKTRAEIEVLAAAPRFDFYCWDLYARASQWYEQDKQNLQKRLATLHAIEEGNNETAAIADLISIAVLRRHLETMDRLDIEYDFLPRESEILHLHFWDAAFTKLERSWRADLRDRGKEQRLLGDAAGGDIQHFKHRGCRRPGGRQDHGGGPKSHCQVEWHCRVCRQGYCLPHVEVRAARPRFWISQVLSLSKWPGLLDFEHAGREDHPHFGDVAEIYNVIDARQAEAQNTVIEALRGLGHSEAADRYTHFSYEMVALTPRCAAELGYELSEEDKARPWIEVSGRKGFGVKADDLMDALIASATYGS